MARDVVMNFRRGAGSSLEVLFGEVSMSPTILHNVGTGATVLPAPTKRDLINGSTTFVGVIPTPAPVDGMVAWAYKVVARDRHGKSWEYLVGVPDGVPPINFTDLPRYFETKPPLFGQGPPGAPGNAATIAIGTTSSGATPSVTNSGTSTNAVLNFQLPQGPAGPAGAGVPAGGAALQFLRKNAANTTTEWSNLDKAAVGLPNVDNTSDANKPVSTATQTALNSLEGRTDTNVSVLVETTTSLLRESLDEIYEPKGGIYVNVRDYGAVAMVS